ncbi:MAG TPA: hypothetical protein PLE99_02280 [Candidatus Thiothrix moscowensis]|uniref:hypothetical protein n=1 Tax=unclassified Thiothrix TaxID=2636184 RepID=UPI0025D1B0D5|nr:MULTISPECIES: hypothetical protein [unclassified Thiothrix]HRJ51567.1 hypothetical protein [Candidatus Thiothrix moscowensis]HRJ91882.1 hypothetical protein [Candidatus Thiothrix moscowensis]
MKNYLVMGEKWVRAIVFADEQCADRYIEKNCTNISYQRYSAEEFNAAYADAELRVMEYGVNDYMARALIVICRDAKGNRLSDC